MIQKIDIHLHPHANDPKMEKYLKIMDKHNVEAGLLHGLEDIGWTGKDGDTANDAVVSAIKAHPGRFYGTVCVNFSKGIEKTLKTIKAFNDKGCMGIKLFPNCGFDPNDDQYEPIWKEVEKRNMLVFSHCGWLMPNEKDPSARIASIDGGSPFHFEVPARRHPKVKFIFAHFGGGATYLETLVLTSRLKNTFADCCPGWGRWVFENNLSGIGSMNRSQFLYGTDNAGEYYGIDDIWWTEKLLSLGFKYGELEMFFYSNSAKILGIIK